MLKPLTIMYLPATRKQRGVIHVSITHHKDRIAILEAKKNYQIATT